MKKNIIYPLLLLALIIEPFLISEACTGIRLIAMDGGVVYGRTMEWGTFDLHSRVAIIPRGYAFRGLTPDGLNGKVYIAKYGVVGLDMINKDYLADGMNEKGLAVGMFYHPGFAEYADYKKSDAAKTITALDVTNFLLTQFANVEEVIKGIQEIRLVGVIEPAIGIEIQGHWMVTDKSGKSIVIEATHGEIKIHDAPIGVITNAPNYDWHLINLRNYGNLSAFSFPTKNLGTIEIKQLGGGSGMLGLPGDNTPPSRFVRAAAWTHTKRNLPNASEAVYETFRILDNFNLSASGGSSEGGGENSGGDLMRSSTIWTTAWNLTDLVLNFHTMHDRRVRSLDIKSIDFSKIGKEIIHIEIDKQKQQDVNWLKF